MGSSAFDSLLAELSKYLNSEGFLKSQDDQCILEIDDLTVGFKFFPGSCNIMIFSDLGKIPLLSSRS